MKDLKTHLLLSGALSAFLFTCQLRASIERVVLGTASPVRYGRTDLSIALTADFASPFTSSDISVDFIAKTPSGREIVTPAFFVEGKSGATSVWAVRFVPPEAGNYRGVCRLRSSKSEATSSPISFTVKEGPNKGFLRQNGNWSFRFDNGTVFRGLGLNLCWESRVGDDSRFFKGLHENPRFNYDTMLGSLSSDGGNFFRTWISGWNFPIEWKHPWDSTRYQPSDSRFNPSACARLDTFLERLESLDLYTMLAMDYHGAYLGSSWEKNPYNKANGGFAATADEFFRSPQARAMYKDRLRYIIARWGYSPHIACWEFFNEIDNVSYGVHPKIDDAVITDWHREMSEFLRDLDPNHHLITTSVSHRDIEGMGNLPALDFNQRHIYGRSEALPGAITSHIAKYGKPYVIGEYGFEWDWSKNFNSFADDMDREFKKGLWLGLFSPTPILPMSWWWEFFDDRGLLPYLKRVRGVSDAILADSNGTPASFDAAWSGDAGNLHALLAGKRLYVLLSNPTPKASTGSLRLPNVTTGATVTIFDPEKNLHSEVPVSEALKSLTLPANQELVLTFEIP